MRDTCREVNESRTPKQYPTIKGLTWHRHQYYSFFAPIDWHRFSWSDDRQGEITDPEPNDPSLCCLNTINSRVFQELGMVGPYGELWIPQITSLIVIGSVSHPCPELDREVAAQIVTDTASQELLQWIPQTP